MSPVIAGILEIAKPIAAKAFLKKVKREVVKIEEETDKNIIGTVGIIEESYKIHKGKAAGWASIAIALSYFASSQGWITPEIANLIDVILSNPETVEAIEGVVE